MKRALILLYHFFLYSITCYSQDYKVEILRLNPKLDNIIAENATIEILAEGMTWTEGPLWLEKEKMLLFSDIPTNSIYKWTKEKGIEHYLTPSGYTGSIPRGGETGSNGLLLNSKRQLVLCQHGDRKIALMDAPLLKPVAKFITLANAYKGKKFDSPNDAAFKNNGDLFFTDPPYGLEKNIADPNKEAPYNGVYKLDIKGNVTLLTDTITRPNGIAFLPGQKQIIIANSDSRKPYWYIYDLTANDALINGRIFYDATQEAKTERGGPDGLKIDNKGIIYASGPGGIWIFHSSGTVLGKIKVSDRTSNCSLSKDWIYITANKRVIRVKLK